MTSSQARAARRYAERTMAQTGELLYSRPRDPRTTKEKTLDKRVRKYRRELSQEPCYVKDIGNAEGGREIALRQNSFAIDLPPRDTWVYECVVEINECDPKSTVNKANERVDPAVVERFRSRAAKAWETGKPVDASDEKLCADHVYANSTGVNLKKGRRVERVEERRELFWTAVANYPGTFPTPKNMAYDGEARAWTDRDLQRSSKDIETLMRQLTITADHNGTISGISTQYSALGSGQNDGQSATGIDGNGSSILDARAAAAQLAARQKSARHSLLVPLKLSRCQQPRFYRVTIEATEPKILRFEDTRRLPWDYANAKRTSSITLVASVLSALSENPFRKRDTKHEWTSGRTPLLVPEKREEMLMVLSANKQVWMGIHKVISVAADGYATLGVDLTCSPVFVGGEMTQVCRNIMEQTYRQPCTMQQLRSIMQRGDWNICRQELLASGAQCDVYSAQLGPKAYHNALVFQDFGDVPAMSKFLTKEGVEMTVATYYQQEYQYTIQFPELPVVVLSKRGGTKRQMSIPMELVTVKFRRLRNEDLSPEERANIIRNTAMEPRLRIERTLKFASMYFRQAPLLFNLQLGSEFVDVSHSGRVLAPPVLFMKGAGGEQRAHYIDQNRGMGDWRFSENVHFRAPAKELRFTLLVVGPPAPDMTVLRTFVDKMMSNAEAYGMKYKSREPIVPPVLAPQYKLSEQLTNLCKTIEQEAKRVGVHPSRVVVFVYFRNKNLEAYRLVKTVCDVQFGVVSQVFVEKTMQSVCKSAPGASNLTATNLNLKLNQKLGGINFTVGPPGGSTASPHAVNAWRRICGKDVNCDEKWMVMAIDSGVPQRSSSDQDACSYMSVCASLTRDQQVFAVSERVMKSCLGDAMAHRLTSMFVERLRAYRENSKTLPEHVFIYRSAFVHTSFEVALLGEMNALQTAFKAVGGSFPKITYVLVNKGHNTRLYVKNEKDGAGRMRNVPAGTVADDECDDTAFFLASAGGIQGTTRPTKYRVIYNTNELNADELKGVTFSLCHQFQRCNKSISHPGPLRYAMLNIERLAVHEKGARALQRSYMLETTGNVDVEPGKGPLGRNNAGSDSQSEIVSTSESETEMDFEQRRQESARREVGRHAIATMPTLAALFEEPTESTVAKSYDQGMTQRQMMRELELLYQTRTFLRMVQVAQLPPSQRLEPFVDAEVEAQIDLETWEFIRSRRQLEAKQARDNDAEPAVSDVERRLVQLNKALEQAREEVKALIGNHASADLVDLLDAGNGLSNDERRVLKVQFERASKSRETAMCDVDYSSDIEEDEVPRRVALLREDETLEEHMDIVRTSTLKEDISKMQKRRRMTDGEVKRNFAKVYSRYQRKLLYMELIDSVRRVLLNDALPAIDVDDTRLKQLCATAKEKADAICLELMKTEPGSMDMIDERLREAVINHASVTKEIRLLMSLSKDTDMKSAAIRKCWVAVGERLARQQQEIQRRLTEATLRRVGVKNDNRVNLPLRKLQVHENLKERIYFA